MISSQGSPWFSPRSSLDEKKEGQIMQYEGERAYAAKNPAE